MAYYAPGTRYSNSVIYDEATDRANEFGDTIFVQKNEDGTPTGREAVVVGGRLIGLEIADQVHAELVRQAAPDLLNELEGALAALEAHGFTQLAGSARAAIAKARG